MKNLSSNRLTEKWDKCTCFRENLGGLTNLEIWTIFVYTKIEYIPVKLEICKPTGHWHQEYTWTFYIGMDSQKD